MTKFRGPGPNIYQLPPTIGTNNHDPTLKRAPGYSFGTRRSYSYTHGPGPYYLEGGISNRGKVTSTGFSLHGRPKRTIWEVTSGSSPGPVYSVNNSFAEKRTPSYSFGAPFKQNYRTDAPGPNAYQVTASFGRNTRAAVIGGRASDSKSFSYDFAKTPGPAHYGNAYSYQTSHGPAYTMAGRTKLPGNKLITPGPNTYLPPLDGSSPRSPRFSLGVRHHEEVLVLPDVTD